MPDFSRYKIDVVQKGMSFAAGPAWSPDNYLICSDVPVNKILKLTSAGTSLLRENSGGASGNAFDSRGRLHTCETRARRVTRSDGKGKVEVLAETFEGKRLNAPNDIAVSAKGQIYFTDPAYGAQQDTRELPFYGVFMLDGKQLHAVAKYQTRPGGLALSPDGKKLYVSNSDERNVRVFNIGKDGMLEGEKMLVEKLEGIPAGLCTDAAGNVYVAGRGVSIFAEDGSKLPGVFVNEPASGVTFGDGDLGTLYVSARAFLFKVRPGD